MLSDNLGLRLAVALQLVLIAFQINPSQCASYHEGDFVPTARKFQFQQTRSEWHDLLGRHCPRFGVDQLVVVPLLKPQTWDEGDEYKMMLSFDTERVLTTWLTLIGKRAPKAPLVIVTLTSVGSELRRVSAEVVSPGEHYLKFHPSLLQEYSSADRWPKHVLIHYTWEQYNEVDAEAGLLVLLVSGLVTFMLLVIIGVAKTGNKLEPAVMELLNNMEVKDTPELRAATSEPSGYPRPPSRPSRPPPPKRGSHND